MDFNEIYLRFLNDEWLSPEERQFLLDNTEEFQLPDEDVELPL